MSISFLLIMITSLFNGNANIQYLPPVSNSDEELSAGIEIQFPCGDETCFVIIDPSGISSGP